MFQKHLFLFFFCSLFIPLFFLVCLFICRLHLWEGCWAKKIKIKVIKLFFSFFFNSGTNANQTNDDGEKKKIKDKKIFTIISSNYLMILTNFFFPLHYSLLTEIPNKKIFFILSSIHLFYLSSFTTIFFPLFCSSPFFFFRMSEEKAEQRTEVAPIILYRGKKRKKF